MSGSAIPSPLSRYGGTFSNGGSTGPAFFGADRAVKDFGTTEGYTATMQRGAAAAGVGFGDILFGQACRGLLVQATGRDRDRPMPAAKLRGAAVPEQPESLRQFRPQQGWTSATVPDPETSSTDTAASILGFGNMGSWSAAAFAPGATARVPT